MISKALLKLTLAAAALQTVAADFYIFAGMNNDQYGATYEALFLNGAPDCDDAVNSVPLIIGDDASSGGLACDGCDISKNMQDWDITRFEFYDGPDAIGSATDSPYSLTSGALGHITLYEDRGYSLDWVSLDGATSGTAGSCVRTAYDGQYLECATGPTGPTIGALSGYQLFYCTTDLTILGASGN